MKKIILINIYFGSLPTTFPLWLKSIEKNPQINFLLITDDKTQYEYPSNIKVIYDTFEHIKEMFKKNFNFNITLDSPYKLCEYKPFYNLILNEEIKKFDFWGYCDLDLIFGNIEKFITDDVLENYDKIYDKGHLTLFRNNKLVNDAIKSSLIFTDCYNYIEALTTKYICHFDEGYGVSKIFEHLDLKQYKNVDCADINQKKYYFQNLFRDDLIKKRGVYKWENGNLYFIDKDNNRTELIYAHFQKRKMTYEKSILDKDVFYIVPNTFEENLSHDISFYCRKKIFYFSYFKTRIGIIITNLKNGSLIEKIYRKVKNKKLGKLRYNKILQDKVGI